MSLLQAEGCGRKQGKYKTKKSGYIPQRAIKRQQTLNTVQFRYKLLIVSSCFLLRAYHDCLQHCASKKSHGLYFFGIACYGCQILHCDQLIHLTMVHNMGQNEAIIIIKHLRICKLEIYGFFKLRGQKREKLM